MRFSPTKLSTFKWCKQQYFYKYILHIPVQKTPVMERGIYVHSLISSWLKGEEQPPRIKDDWGYATGQQIFHNAINILTREKMKGISELKIWKKNGEDEIGGIIDYFDNNRIIDFKVVQKLKKWRSPLQLALYSWVIGKRNKYCYLQLREEDSSWVCYDNEEISFYQQEMFDIIDEIKEWELVNQLTGEEFPRKKTKYCKQYCSFYDVCIGGANDIYR